VRMAVLYLLNGGAALETEETTQSVDGKESKEGKQVA